MPFPVFTMFLPKIRRTKSDKKDKKLTVFQRLTKHSMPTQIYDPGVRFSTKQFYAKVRRTEQSKRKWSDR